MDEYGLFNLIKSHKYDDFIDIINNNKDINLNIKDNSNIYLIQYAILYNNLKIVEFLLKKNVNIDIIDENGRILLYVPIKYNYIDIIKIMLLYNEKYIGISILDILDNHKNCVLHYAIIFNNLEIVKLLLKYKFYINICDKNDNNSLHLSIKQKNYEICRLLIDKNININQLNINGETPLFIAINIGFFQIVNLLLDNNSMIDNKEYKKQLTPFLISGFNGYIDICDKLYKKGIDINEQDIIGNTILHYAIKHKDINLYKNFYKLIDINLINIDGDDILHYLLNNIFENYDIYDIDYLIKNSNVNSQDINGNTSLFKLIKLNIWEKYYSILEKKKLKIFLKNHDDICIYDYIKNKYNFDKFIDLISNSYYYLIEINKLNIFKNEWKELCNNTTKNICIEKIKKYIIEHKKSYPQENRAYNINLLSNNINFITFTGITLDIVCGLIYILKKYNNVKTSLTKNFIFNDELYNYYVSNGIVKNYDFDFLNFEILWIYQKIFYPTTLKKLINDFLNDDKYRYLIIPVGIELSNGSHSNILLYDKKTNDMERFEPNGKDNPINFNYNPKLLDEILIKYFKQFIPHINYLNPSYYQEKIGPQMLDTIETKKNKYIGDPNGFCASWCLWYVDNRIFHDDIDRKYLIKKLLNYSKINNITIRQLIRNYSKHITDVRDGYLNKQKKNINDWLNDNYDKKTFDNIIKNITNIL